MSYAKFIMGAAIIGLMSTSAAAQINTVVEPVPTQVKTLDELPITYTDEGVIKAQHIKPGDISPEEYASLLEEAEKVRAFRSSSEGYVSTNEASGYEIQLFAEPITQLAPVTYAGTTHMIFNDTSVPAKQTHSVIKGDTLYNISKRFGVSIDDIRASNNMTTNNINLGQVLVIPSRKITDRADVVQDAPKSIATVSTETVSVPSTTTSATGRIIRTVQPIPGKDIYAVLPKDNLYQIAKRACTTIDVLVDLNSISDVTALQPGQRLQLPAGHCQK